MHPINLALVKTIPTTAITTAEVAIPEWLFLPSSKPSTSATTAAIKGKNLESELKNQITLTIESASAI